MKVLALIEQLEDLIENASTVPLTGKVMVSREEVIAILRDIRLVMPDEMKQAQWITDARNKILDDADAEASRLQRLSEKQANDLIAQTHSRVEKMVQKDEITKIAEQNAGQIVAQAEKNAAQIRQAAYRYADEIMQKLEANVAKVGQSIHKNRAELESYQTKAQ